MSLQLSGALLSVGKSVPLSRGSKGRQVTHQGLHPCPVTQAQGRTQEVRPQVSEPPRPAPGPCLEPPPPPPVSASSPAGEASSPPAFKTSLFFAHETLWFFYQIQTFFSLYITIVSLSH